MKKTRSKKSCDTVPLNPKRMVETKAKTWIHRNVPKQSLLVPPVSPDDVQGYWGEKSLCMCDSGTGLLCEHNKNTTCHVRHSHPQSNEFTRDPPELVQHFRL